MTMEKIKEWVKSRPILSIWARAARDTYLLLKRMSESRRRRSPSFSDANEGKGGFFDDYGLFLESGRAGNEPVRLNFRHQLIFEQEIDLFRGAKVIDIGSHDCRWSFAALKGGADRVLGIEARDAQVQAGIKNLQAYGIRPEVYEFRAGDAFEILGDLDVGAYRFDIGLVLGFLYHTTRHHELFSHLDRLGCHILLIETNVIPEPNDSIVRYRAEDITLAHNAFSQTGVDHGVMIVGLPSVSAVQLMLSAFNYDSVVCDLGPIPNDVSVIDFLQGRRVLIKATKKPVHPD